MVDAEELATALRAALVAAEVMADNQAATDFCAELAGVLVQFFAPVGE